MQNKGITLNNFPLQSLEYATYTTNSSAGLSTVMYKEFIVCNVPGNCISKHRERNNI